MSSFNAFTMGHCAFFNCFTFSVLVLGVAIRPIFFTFLICGYVDKKGLRPFSGLV